MMGRHCSPYRDRSSRYPVYSLQFYDARPLSVAASNGHVDTLRAMITAGAYPKVRTCLANASRAGGS